MLQTWSSLTSSLYLEAVPAVDNRTSEDSIIANGKTERRFKTSHSTSYIAALVQPLIATTDGNY